VAGEDEAAGVGGGVLTGELLHSTGVISCLPSVVISSSLLFSPDRAPPVGEFCTSVTQSVRIAVFPTGSMFDPIGKLGQDFEPPGNLAGRFSSLTQPNQRGVIRS